VSKYIARRKTSASGAPTVPRHTTHTCPVSA